MKEILTKFLLLISYFILSWGCVVLLVQLAAKCFGLDCTMIQATGVWIVMILLRITFNFNKGSKK